MKAAIYVHIPFCARKCAYCDFESYAGRLSCAGEYLSRVKDEARAAREKYGSFGVPSVYIGGGTPSLLPAEEIAGLLDALSALFSFDSDAEISMEANPGTVDAAKLRAIRASGVNRLSFGAQAAQTRLLRTLERIHRWDDVRKAADCARRAGFENWNLDLMYGLPGQTRADFAESVEKALALKPTHISCYSLILEEGTKLTERVRAGQFSLPEDEETLDMRREAERIMENRGFARYEISNYALPGRQCRHNIAYWTRENYLGLGCAAHSLMNETRFSNPGFDDYMKGRRETDAQSLSREEELEETVMLETRMTRGLSLANFEKRFGATRARELLSQNEALEKAGLTKCQNGFLALTDAGLDVQNAVILRLISTL